tara:strand:+ start:879 stop:2069 length:1191 start_codon:yes stop_codon:yes gene_type:complete
MDIKNKSKKISIIGGAGRVGFPFSMVLASLGFTVEIIDTDEDKMKMIKNGKSPFLEKGIEKTLKNIKNLNISFSTNFNNIKNADIVILTIGTPIDEYLNPDYKNFFKTLDDLFLCLKNNQLLILRSTLFPGTSRKINDLLKKNKLSLKLAYCPERISQGNCLEEITVLPQIISANSKKAINETTKFFKLITKKVIILEFEEAELSKLFSNSWRYIKFAIANQFYTICEENNLDFEKIRSAMTMDYDRAIDLPKSGFSAGPCLLKDTMQLSAYSRDKFTLGHSSMLTNEYLPNFLVNKTKAKIQLEGKTVGILGMAFKPNNDDIRDSLAYKLKKILINEGAKVLCSDYFISDKSFVDTKNLLTKCEIIFIGCPHQKYKKIKFHKRHHVVDCWGFSSY